MYFVMTNCYIITYLLLLIYYSIKLLKLNINIFIVFVPEELFQYFENFFLQNLIFSFIL